MGGMRCPSRLTWSGRPKRAKPVDAGPLTRRRPLPIPRPGRNSSSGGPPLAGFAAVARRRLQSHGFHQHLQVFPGVFLGLGGAEQIRGVIGHDGRDIAIAVPLPADTAEDRAVSERGGGDAAEKQRNSGRMISICRSRNGRQWATSSGRIAVFGRSRFQDVGDVNLSRVKPIPLVIMSVSRLPARPTNGRPVRSSSAPGASPTNMSRAVGAPEPKTVWVREAARCGHWAQTATSAASAASNPGRSAAGTGGPSNPVAPNKVAASGAAANSGRGVRAVRSRPSGLPQRRDFPRGKRQGRGGLRTTRGNGREWRSGNPIQSSPLEGFQTLADVSNQVQASPRSIRSTRRLYLKDQSLKSIPGPIGVGVHGCGTSGRRGVGWNDVRTQCARRPCRIQNPGRSVGPGQPEPPRSDR